MLLLSVVYLEFRYGHQKMYEQGLEVKFVDETVKFKKYLKNFLIEKKFAKNVKIP